MGPFSNNSTPQPPANSGNKLPVPDVEGQPQVVVVSPEPDTGGAKKWLVVTLVIAGSMAVAGIILFAFYVYISNTPNYMLSAAFQNFISSDGEAGTVRYDMKQKQGTSTVQGNFLSYTDPTDPHTISVAASLGQDASRVNASVRLFSDANFIQTSGMANLGRLVQALHGDGSKLTNDALTRLSGLDNQWYTFTLDDVHDLNGIVPRQVQGSPTSTVVETLQQLYLKNQFIVSAQQFGDETVEKINSMHLKVTVDPAKLQAFLQDVKASNQKPLQLSDADIQAIMNSNALANTTIEVWIARSDRTFQQIRLTQTQPGGDTNTLTLTFHSELVATQRQSVQKPEGAKSASILLRGLNDVLNGTRAKTTAQ
jgi:hypothetical protein